MISYIHYKILILLLIAHFGIVFTVNAQLQYNDNCKRAFEYNLAFDFDRMDSVLELEQKINPKNPVIDYIKAYSYFLQYGVSENDAYLANFEKYYEKSVEAIIDLPQTEYSGYLLTDLYMQSAFMSALQENYFSALFIFKKAYNVIHENAKKYPKFVLNKKMMGLLDVAIGSIPKSYNWALSILNVSGEMKKGYSQLQEVLELSIKKPEYKHLFVENLLLFTFIQNNYTNKEKDNLLLKEIYSDSTYSIKYADNPLFAFSKASYYHQHKKNEKVIEALQIVNTKSFKKHNNIAYLNFMMGQSLLYQQNMVSVMYFQRYLTNYSGNNFTRAAHQKIAWSYLLNGELSAYIGQKEKIINAKGELFDSDKQALKEAKSDEVPNVKLLKSRMLFDGGYFAKADSVLRSGLKTNSYKSQRDKLEFTYRIGRIYDDWGNFDIAERYYKKSIDESRNFKYFYAANSALHLAYRYEQIGKTDEARKYYKLIMELDFDEYHNGITQKAKAGLSRLGE